MTVQAQAASGAGTMRNTILVNGRPRHLEQTSISYDEVVKTAYPNGPFGDNIVYTVDYIHGPVANPEGSLVAGESVAIRDGMRFNVTPTDKS